MYVLEIGQCQSVKMPHTYMRRAQATLYQTVWHQSTLCAEIEPLKQLAVKMARPGLEFRISGVGEHCTFEPVMVAVA